MHTFAQRSNAQQTVSDSQMLFGRSSLTQSRALTSSSFPQSAASPTIAGHSNESLGFHHDFSSIPLHSAHESRSRSPGRLDMRSEPAVKQPEAPKPQKDENPLGTLKDKQTGVEEKIYPSFVTKGLW